MIFGMPTLVECKDIYECIEVCRTRGLGFVEINLSFPQYLPSALDAAELVSLGKRYGVGYTIHADEMLNPFDFNAVVSECYFDVMRDTIRFAKAIGATVINMHLLKGVYVTLPDRVILLSDVYFEEYSAAVRRFIKMCEEEIGDADLKIAIENVDTNAFSKSQLDMLPEFMASPVFGLTLDTGHELCLGYADSPVFAEYPEKLIHMHLHDAKGKSAHLPLGSAEVKIGEKLSMLPTDKRCLVEVKTIAGLDRSVEYLKKNGYIEEK